LCRRVIVERGGPIEFEKIEVSDHTASNANDLVAMGKIVQRAYRFERPGSGVLYRIHIESALVLSRQRLITCAGSGSASAIQWAVREWRKWVIFSRSRPRIGESALLGRRSFVRGLESGWASPESGVDRRLPTTDAWHGSQHNLRICLIF
jgi:hypothetical protein